MSSLCSGRKLWLTLAVLCLALPAAAAPPATAADWPKYRHDRLQSAVSTESLQLPLKNVWYFRSRLSHVAPKNPPVRLAVTARFGSGNQLLPDQVRYALTVTSAGDGVFFTTHDGRVVCLDAKTAAIKWQYVTGGAITCSATLADGNVYVGSDDGYVYCLDAKTGVLVWKYDPVKRDRWLISFGRMSSVWPVRTDVVIDEGVGYFGSGIFPHEGMFINALDVKKQERNWRSACYGYGLAGHGFLAKSVFVLPTELKGFHGRQLMFKRSDGGEHRGGWSPEVKANRNLLHEGGGGAVVDGVRYTTNYNNNVQARDIKDEHDGKKRKMHWQVNVPGMIFDSRQTAYAGGVFYVLGNAYQHVGPNRPPSGSGGAVYAFNAKDGKVLWSTRVPERVHHIAIANGRLFVSTRSGTIYCYAPESTEAAGVVDEPAEPDPFVQLDQYGEAPRPGHPIAREAYNACRHAVGRMLAPKKHPHLGLGLEGKGFALVFDCTDGLLPYILAKRSDYYICAVFDDEAKAQRARELYAKANLHCSRISVLYCKPGEPLPYPARFADLIVSEQAIMYGRLPLYTAELERMLKPVRGVVLIGGRDQVDLDGVRQKLPVAEWAKSQEPAAVEAAPDKPKAKPDPMWALPKPEHGFAWAQRSIPALKNAGGWTHPNGSPGNTRCSQDSVLKAPLGITWYGPPHVTKAFNRPPLLSNGVMVCPINDEAGIIEAYDAYTGRKLWRYEVPKEKGENAARYIAMMAVGGDGVFIPDGNVNQNVANKGVTRLDLWTGKATATYQVPFPEMRMGNFAVSADGKTFWRSGYGDKTKTSGDWTCLFAMDTETGKIRWMLGGPGKTKPFGLYREGVRYERWSAIADGRIFIMRAGASAEQVAKLDAAQKAYLKENDPEAFKNFKQLRRRVQRFTALDAMTGETLYNSAVDVQGCVRSAIVAHNGKVLFMGNAGEKWWGGFGGGAFKNNSIAVHDAATGKFLWKKKTNHRFDPVVTDDTIYAEPWIFDLATGKKKRRMHPITGVEGTYAWVRHGKQCGGYNGSTHLVFGRSKGFGYFDAQRDRGFYTSWHHRQSCSIDTATGSGMMIKPPFNLGCGCPWSLPYTMAMATMTAEPAIPFAFFQSGRSLPVKELRINFGASGDRADKDGKLWFDTRRFHHPSGLQLELAPITTYYKIGGEGTAGTSEHSRRSASDVPAANTSSPFIFDAFALGLRRFVVPVTTPKDGKGTYVVRLGFSALPGDELGQRVFDVRLNGKTMLKDFDIVKEAGRAHSAVWKEFTIGLDGNLVIDLVAKSKQPTAAQVPLINGLEILRQKMSTLGFKAPKSIWLNEAKPERIVTLHVANHRSTPFRGKLVIEAAGGIVATLPNAGAIELAPGAKTKIEVSIKNSNPAKTGSQVLTLKLISSTGKVEHEQALAVDCLGKLERSTLRGNGRWCMTRKSYMWWLGRVTPAHGAGRLPATKGARKPGDLGGAYSWLKFYVRPEIGKVRSMKVRLHVSPELWASWNALHSPDIPARPRPGCWGKFRLIDSVKSVEVNPMGYPKVPKLRPGSYALKPTDSDPNVVEASLPADVKRDKNRQGIVQLILEPTVMNGPVYWAPQGSLVKPEHTPKLIIDHEPKPKKQQ